MEKPGAFRSKLEAAARRHHSLLCVGLDPEEERLPSCLRGQADRFLAFGQAIVEATADLVCAYKPNLAFYEALGLEGLEALRRTLEAIPPEIPVIGDAKRGDIGSTARAYARALFEVWNFDAATVSPYLGRDSLEPFLAYPHKGTFVLCKTSNPGAQDFQELLVLEEGAPARLYEVVARRIQEVNEHGNLGLVVGATYPEALGRIRQMAPDMLLLIPGIGPQGGELSVAVKHGIDKEGGGAIFSASRQVLYASPGKDFAQAARRQAKALRDQINRYRQEKGPQK